MTIKMDFSALRLATNNSFCAHLAKELGMTHKLASTLMCVYELGAVSKERLELMDGRESSNRHYALTPLKDGNWIDSLDLSRGTPAGTPDRLHLWEIRQDRRPELEDAINRAIAGYRNSLAEAMNAEPLKPSRLSGGNEVQWQHSLDDAGEAVLHFRLSLNQSSTDSRPQFQLHIAGSSLKYNQKLFGGVAFYRVTDDLCTELQTKAGLHAIYGGTRKRFRSPEAALKSRGITLEPITFDSVVNHFRERIDPALPDLDMTKVSRLSANKQNVIVPRLEDSEGNRLYPKRVFKTSDYQHGMSQANLLFLAKLYVLCALCPDEVSSLDLTDL